MFVCLITKSFLTDSFSLTLALPTICRPCQASITPETTKVSSSWYNYMMMASQHEKKSTVTVLFQLSIECTFCTFFYLFVLTRIHIRPSCWLSETPWHANNVIVMISGVSWRWTVVHRGITFDKKILFRIVQLPWNFIRWWQHCKHDTC